MKKQDALKNLPGYVRKDVEHLERKKAYIIDWFRDTMIIQITHFHKNGIIFKPLSTASLFSQETRTGRIRYGNIRSHNFRPASLHDITCAIGRGTRFMSDYYGDTKNLLKLHGTEL